MSDPHPLDTFLQERGSLFVGVDGQMLAPASGRCPDARALLPGSFNPLHAAHLALARVAEEILGCPVAFELSVLNVDKPALTGAEIRRRLAPFNWLAPVWLTHAPRFVGKATCFPKGVTFVVGADTALRLVLPRYYDDDVQSMHAALATLRLRECRFLVACRADAQGRCMGLSDLPIPAEFRECFMAIPRERFRMDLSSTELRKV